MEVEQLAEQKDQASTETKGSSEGKRLLSDYHAYSQTTYIEKRSII